MPFSRKLLNPHEEVAVDLHPHWWYFAKPVASVIAAVALGIVVLVWDSESGVRTGVTWLVVISIFVAIAWLVVRYLTWSTTHFVITNDRVIFRAGVLAKSGIEIPLERVNTVHFNQSIFERIVGAGDLVVESGAEDGQQRFTDIRHPDAVQREIHVQKDLNQRRRSAFHAPGTDVADQLERLEGMLNRGTLTPEEFQAQKDKLLGH